MISTDQKIWEKAKRLFDDGISILEIRKEINYKGTNRNLLRLCESGNNGQKYKNYRQKKRQKIIDYFGGVCQRCGFSDRRALQIDHVNGGGVREVHAIGNFRIYQRLIKRIDAGELILDYQLLCANCNWIKKNENDENPRKS